MDLKKIGKYIAEKRKVLGLTQAQVAEKLGMSDKSVSKWERGICLPDVSVYMELCEILGISLNEFIAGEDLEQENVVKASEENLIQVTKDGKQLRKKMKWIILALLCVSGILGILLVSSYIKDKEAVNYMEPLAKDSAEAETAQLLAGVDGAYLYDFVLDSKWTGLTMELSIYDHGILSSKETLGQIDFAEEDTKSGRIAVVPDFEEFKVNLVIAGAGTKFSTEFDILENVENREYYGRSATEIDSRTTLSEETEKGLLALIYGKDGLRMIPISELGKETDQSENDYIYYISVTFFSE